MLALERIPIPYPLLVALVGVMAAVEQMLEYSIAVQMGAVMPNPLGQATVFVVLFVYILIVLADAEARRSRGACGVASVGLHQ